MTRVRSIPMVLLIVLYILTGCNKSDDPCYATEVQSFQLLVSAHVLVTNTLMEPLPFEDNITLVMELQNCEGIVEEKIDFKGSTDSQGVMSKNGGFTIDNKEDRVRVHARYGSMTIEDTEWVEYDDTKGTYGQVHVQLNLRVDTQ